MSSGHGLPRRRVRALGLAVMRFAAGLAPAVFAPAVLIPGVLGVLISGVLGVGTLEVALAGQVKQVDRVKIAVGDKVLTLREVTEIREVRISELKSRVKGDELKARLKAMEESLHDNLIEEMLLEIHAERLKIEISDRTLEERLDKILRRDPNMEQLYTHDQIKSFILKDLLRRRVLGREVDSRILISETEIRAACRRRAGNAREVDVGHILIRTGGDNPLQRLQAIRERLEKGADFEELARAHSQDPSVKDNKGRLGFISKGQFLKAFEAVAFNLPVGGLSDPVKTRLGHHLIKVFDERIKSGLDCDNLDDVARTGLRNQLFAKQRRERLDVFFTLLRKTASIQVLD